MTTTTEAPPRHRTAGPLDGVTLRPAAAEDAGPLDGVILRPAAAEDAGPLGDMLAGLTVESSFRRFLCGLGRPSSALLAGLLRCDRTHGAWLAVVAGDRPIGHAMWALDDGTAEFGVVVADAWQARGIGGRLVRLAVAEAAAAGAVEVRADVHVENRRVIAILHRALPGAVVSREAQTCTFRAPLVSVPRAPRTTRRSRATYGA